MQARLAIVDVETTGADPAADRVTEIAVLQAEGGALTGEWSTLVNPGTSIPGVIRRLPSRRTCWRAALCRDRR
jgi:DNA polymerase III epsilon subunit-like protein